jgi:Tfp pilus assembly protein PilO
MKKNIQTGFLFFIIVFIGAIVWFFIYYTPTRAETGKIQSELKVLDRKIKQDIPEARIFAVKREADSLSQSLQQRKNRIYPMTEFMLLGRRVQDAINPYDLTLVSLNPKYERLEEIQRDSAEIVELPMTIVLKGGYTGFTRFFDHQADLPFVIRADAFNLKREDVAKTDVLFSLEGIIFLRKTTTGPKPQAVPVPAAPPKT